MLYVGIDHPSIACYDVRKQTDWYCRTFGMRVIASNEQDPPAVVVGYGESTLGGAMIELMPSTEPGPRPESATRFQPGLRHVALRVSDFAAAYQQLKLLGVAFITDPGQAVGGGRTVLFRDPEGNELQIVER
jgi:catechol 2,3-dioxygenase-like lactoylglutathione lyase family enzyme